MSPSAKLPSLRVSTIHKYIFQTLVDFTWISAGFDLTFIKVAVIPERDEVVSCLCLEASIAHTNGDALKRYD